MFLLSRNIGVYLNAMKQARKGDEKILASLKQMTDLHRNPLIHPEVILTPEEAIATLGIARSAIAAMLVVLPVPPPTTKPSPPRLHRPLRWLLLCGHNLAKCAVERGLTFIATEFTSGLYKPLVFSLVSPWRHAAATPAK
jgi:hypothetical protein